MTAHLEEENAVRSRPYRLLAALALAGAMSLPISAQNWPTFRGPSGSGIADRQDLPTDWDVKTGRNIRWKTAIQGLGHSSPVVWGDRLFVTSVARSNPPALVLGDAGGIRLADDKITHTWRVSCLNAKDGALLWSKDLHSGVPRASRHVKSSQANATPATDGRSVVAILGSEGLVALVVQGNLKWRVDLGVLNPGLYGSPDSEWGHASSPIIFESSVIVQVDRHRDSYLAAFDLTTGKRQWNVPRVERPVWSTPTLHTVGSRAELIVVGGEYVRGYDPRNGQESWRFKDAAEVKMPTPFVAGDLMVFAGGYRGRPLYAIRTGARGDISEPESATSGKYLAWRSETGGPYTTTPLAYQGVIYAVRDEGILGTYDLKTGATLYRQRTNTTHSASPIGSDGRVYLAAEGGEVIVLKAGRTYEVLARNDMGEPVMATPAIANNTMYIRTAGHVYAVGSAPARPLGSGLVFQHP
jgi:outer membrane protein assembly factor BamB